MASSSRNSRFLKWQKVERTKRMKVGALIVAGLAVMVGVPIVFWFLIPFFDQLLRPLFGSWLDMLTLVPFPWEIVLAAIVASIDLIYGIWSVAAQFRIGKGTPIPIIPTQKLVVLGPYKYCRNPMTFGAILLYASIGVFIRSIIWIIIVLVVFTLPLCLYVKLVEEKELGARFGSEYLEYKKRTRFILPLPKRRRET